MKQKRRKFSARFKAKVAVEAIKKQKSLLELSKLFEVHSNQISKWKREFLSNADKVFRIKESLNSKKQLEKLCTKIGKLEVERDFKKKLTENRTVNQRKELIDKDFKELIIRKQASILEVNRSSLYYAPVGESDLNLTLMRILDEIYLKNPAYGVLRMQDKLLEYGYKLNHKRVRRLMRKMGLEAIYPKK